MSDAVEKLSGKLGLDTTDFKTAISAANREMRVLESSFKAGAAALGDWSTSATGLESRAKSLTGQIEIQKLKVSALAEEHKRLVEANGANSRSAQDAEIKLNKETETLNKMSVELQDTNTSLDEMKSGSDDATDSVEDLGAASEETSGILFSFGDALAAVAGFGKLALASIVAVAAAAVAAVGLMTGLAINTADVGSRFADLSVQTGISAERLQEMNYAGEILGVSLETITGAQARLIRSMASAADQTQTFNEKITEANESRWDKLEDADVVLGDMAAGFKTLGVAVTDSSGNLRSAQDVFAEAIDALGQISNPAERDALAMSIFGKSAQELNPIIKAGSKELGKLADEAHRMGAVMSEEDVAAADEFGDKLAGLKAGFSGVVAQIGLAFIPGLSGIADQAKGYLQELVSIVQGSGGDVGQIAAGIGGLLGKVAGDIAAQTPQLLNAGLGIVQALLDAVTANLPVLLSAGTQIIGALVKFIQNALPTLISSGVQILLSLVNGIVVNLPALVQTALLAIVTLADGLTAALPTLTPVIAQTVVSIVNLLVQNMPMLIDAALKLMLALANGISAALPIIIPALVSVSLAIVDGIMAALPQILVAAGQIIMALAQGLAAAVPQTWIQASEGFLANIGIQAALWVLRIQDAARNMITALSNSLRGAVDIGKNFVVGIWNGINGNVQWLLGNIGGFAESIVQYVQAALQIGSPSKKGVAIGANFVRSIALGGQQAMYDVGRQFTQMMGDLTASTSSGAGAGRGASSVNNDNSFDIWGNVIISGDVAPGSLGAALRGRRF
jgi:phage-related protein